MFWIKIPLDPTVKEELLFQTEAPEFVVQYGELKALDGRCCHHHHHHHHHHQISVKLQTYLILRKKIYIFNQGKRWIKDHYLVRIHDEKDREFWGGEKERNEEVFVVLKERCGEGGGIYIYRCVLVPCTSIFFIFIWTMTRRQKRRGPPRLVL